MKALVLAGGKGTRLRPLTFAMAKQLVPVANQPILHYPLDALYEADIREIGIIISPETGEAVRESVAQWQIQKSDSGLTITFIPQDAPLGLAHAVKIAQPFMGHSPFVMYLGDNLINHDLHELIADFKAQPCAASILLTPVDNPSQFGVAELDENQHVVRLVEKPKHPPSNLALIGVYLLTPKIFEAIAQIQPSARGELEITDALQKLMELGYTVRSAIHHGWWLDTGKKDDLLAANRVVLESYVKPFPHSSPLPKGEGTSGSDFTLTIPPSPAAHAAPSPTRGEGSVFSVCPESIIDGAVELGEGTRIIRSTVTGPVRIGANCTITDSTIGPHTSIGNDSQLTGITIENSVLLERCELANIPGRIDHSLMGHGCKIIRSGCPVNPTHQFLLADCSEIQVA